MHTAVDPWVVVGLAAVGIAGFLVLALVVYSANNSRHQAEALRDIETSLSDLV
jgi:hypothetical protein